MGYGFFRRRAKETLERLAGGICSPYTLCIFFRRSFCLLPLLTAKIRHSISSRIPDRVRKWPESSRIPRFTVINASTTERVTCVRSYSTLLTDALVNVSSHVRLSGRIYVYARTRSFVTYAIADGMKPDLVSIASRGWVSVCR